MISEHSVTLHLAPELRSGLIKYMAKHDLDKQYAALSLLVKAMRSEGIISQEAYEVFSSRYGKTVTSLAAPLAPKPLSKDEMQLKQKIDEKTRLFRAVIGDWKYDHKAGWKENWKKAAAEWADRIPEAKKILEMT